MPFKLPEIVGDVSEARETARVVRELPRPLTRNLAASLRLSAQDVLTETRRLLAGTRRRGRKRKGAVRQASVAGEPPARLTGKLARSLRSRTGRRDGLSQIVEARARHGHLLELGHDMIIGRGPRRGQTTGFVSPRPFLTKALANRAEVTTRRLAAALQTTLEEAAKA